jgi:hypothetical protein
MRRAACPRCAVFSPHARARGLLLAGAWHCTRRPFEHYKEAVMSCIQHAACGIDDFAKYGGLAYKRDGNRIVAPAFVKHEEAKL